MKTKNYLFLLTLAALFIAILSIGITNVSAEYPVSIDTMGETTTYNAPPERIVALGYDAVEILCMAGLENQIVALAPSMYQITDIAPECQEKVKDIPILPDGNFLGVPTFETIIRMEPDFVYGTSYSFSSNNCGALEDYTKSNIAVYATEGTYVPNADMEVVYHDFLNIGKIFNKEDKAQAIVDDMKARIESVQDKMKDSDPIPVFVFDDKVSTGIFTAGGKGFQTHLITLAGGKNIFDDVDEEFAVASLEELMARNPQAIIFIEYYTADESKSKIEYVENTPELQDIDAVKNKNYIVLSGYQYFPGPQNVEGIEAIAKSSIPNYSNKVFRKGAAVQLNSNLFFIAIMRYT